ncbi:DNA excision repair protein ERCC-8 [Galdieria sulphuraria]|nr:DNA excision repair protein ERCC-8 [Galdieria sulphuraria]
MNRLGSVSCLRWYTEDNGMFFSLQYLIQQSRISIWDTNLFTEEQVIEYQDMPIYQLTPCPAGAMHSLLALGTNKKVLLLDLRVGQRAVQQLGGWDSGVVCLEWCPQVDYCLATGTLNGDLSLIDWRKPKHNNRLVVMNPYRSSCSNTSQPVLIQPMNQGIESLQRRLSWSPSSTLHFWSKSCYQQIIGCKRKEKMDKVVEMKPLDGLSKQSEMLQHSQEIASHRAHSCSVQSICFLWNSRYLSSLDREGTVQIWDTLTGCLEHSLTCSCLPNKRKRKNAFQWISLGWDNKTLIYALDRNLYSFDAFHGNHITTIQTIGSAITALTSHPWEPLWICGSRNGELIFFGVEDSIYLQKQLPLGVSFCTQK